MLKAVTPAFLLLMGVAIGGFSASTSAQEKSPEASASEELVVSIGRRTSFVSEPIAKGRDGPSDAVSIARNAQVELRRVGCYEGEINGFWSPSSRAAAQRFLDRINAKLPVDTPEDALLFLLRGKSDLICNECPRGQGLDAAGRCMPTALLKRSAIVTGSLPDAPAPQARTNEERSSTAPESATTGSERSQPKPSGYWRRMIWKVDRALGLN
jgi:hypothetical protein